jgi:trans-aconitate methyltransferase
MGWYFKAMDKRLEEFYRKSMEKYGADDPRALHWTMPETQVDRFAVLAQVGDLTDKTILDVGCGVGDFYAFVNESWSIAGYTGLDIHPLMIEAARHKYLGAPFVAQDFAQYTGPGANYCIASGAFSFKIADHKAVYFAMIQKMFELSSVGIAFNMLDVAWHVDNNTFAAYDPFEVYEWCKTLTPDVVLRQDYLPHDFTIYAYH